MPFIAALGATFARWFVECITSVGSDVLLSDKVRAHNTRSISSSWALFSWRLPEEYPGSRLLVDFELFLFVLLERCSLRGSIVNYGLL